MTARILLVDHPIGKRDDRASAALAARGYRIVWCRPAEGDALPDPGAGYAAAVVYGGPESANDGADKDYIAKEIEWVGAWVAADKPFLGLCLGGQILARALGAEVARHPDGLHEVGYAPVRPATPDHGFPAPPARVFQWHKEGFEVPAGAELLVAGEAFANQAFRHGAKAFGLQFHPEVSLAAMNRWIENASHMLAEPGAHPAERQRADAQTWDPPMAGWLEDFLDHWLDGV